MALSASSHAQPSGATGVLVLGDGTVIWGKGFGATGNAVGEVCFNSSRCQSEADGGGRGG